MRRDHGLDFAAIRSAVNYVASQLGDARPLAHRDFATDGVSLLVQHSGALINASRRGQLAIAVVLQSYLQRIERDAVGLAQRFYPFTRSGDENRQPRVVVIDPRLAFGRPAIACVGVSTAAVAGRYRRGESPVELAADFRCSVPDIEEALRCELRDAA